MTSCITYSVSSHQIYKSVKKTKSAWQVIVNLMEADQKKNNGKSLTNFLSLTWLWFC